MALLIPFLAFFLLVPTSSFGYQVLFLVGTRAPVYEKAVEGVKKARTFPSRTVILSDYAEIDVGRVIREDRPEVIVAVGDRALQAVRGVRQTPVVAVMAASLPRLAEKASNITGVCFTVHPERYLSLFETLSIRRVGILYDPAKSGGYLRKAKEAAARHGVELVPRTVKSPREVLSQVKSLSGAVDGLWIIPDSSAAHPQSIEAYFLFGMAQQVPVISFTSEHLSYGAVLALEPDPAEMGAQAGELVVQILDQEPDYLPPLFPRKYVLQKNATIQKRLNLPADRISRFREHP